MKIIFGNKYVKSYQFKSETEFKTFCRNQSVEKQLILEDQGHEYWYCHVFYDSLTSEKLLIIGFNSDANPDELNFLHWNQNLMAFDTGGEVIVINANMQIIARYAFITPLIGFFVTDKSSLLILEEGAMIVFSQGGGILKNEQFNSSVDDWYIKGNCLHLILSGAERVVDL